MTESTIPEPARKPRHDAFDGDRKRIFLDALGKCGCVRDAARKARVSPQTVYNHQARDRRFAHQCELALGMASTDLELHAWERAVTGVEEPILHRGEIVGTRLKRSDALLRLLLQATKRKKYGPNPGFGRKRLVKLERQRLEREVRDELRVQGDVSDEEAERALLKQLDGLNHRLSAERLAKGWTRLADGEWVPPGWVRADRGDEGVERAEQTPDSV